MSRWKFSYFLSILLGCGTPPEINKPADNTQSRPIGQFQVLGHDTDRGEDLILDVRGAPANHEVLFVTSVHGEGLSRCLPLPDQELRPCSALAEPLTILTQQRSSHLGRAVVSLPIDENLRAGPLFIQAIAWEIGGTDYWTSNVLELQIGGPPKRAVKQDDLSDPTHRSQRQGGPERRPISPSAKTRPAPAMTAPTAPPAPAKPLPAVRNPDRPPASMDNALAPRPTAEPPSDAPPDR